MRISKSFFFCVFPVLYALVSAVIWFFAGAGRMSVGGPWLDFAEEVRQILAVPLLWKSRPIMNAISYPLSPILSFSIFFALLIANGFIWGAGLYAGNELILRLRKRLGRA